MEAKCSSKMLINFHWTTLRYIPEERILCKHLKFYTYRKIGNTMASVTYVKGVPRNMTLRDDEGSGKQHRE
jgi:hypothetical protein